ncbi:MAG: phosphoribosylglycinamide formyltransferase [Bacteroidales bacterium]|jgi:phosphoribosylglycinamide formyltransferase-1|nr:phosphoribosylglycinamide formyltransferase [Bacteroidales bacterium]MDD2617342.1 phosphoribosylglycinamide formyltransferase [Bacteroidales bacterium]MDD4640229.1 phosphoribosylglycinamide formyltransferase [Bacteroidales bacterium]NLB02352.1 phosphoribosylglycinamide formyltransferase [Bacteroidales bacterium]
MTILKKHRLAIFASGSGSNAENIVHYFAGRADVEIVLFLSNKKNAYVLERGQKLKIASFAFEKTEMEEGHILKLLQDKQVSFIVLAGYLQIIPKEIIRAYPNKIINIHPALLPKFGGKGMYGDRVHEAVIQAGEKESGITIHYVNEHYDQGAIIFQASCPVLASDTTKELAQRIHELEYFHYPRLIDKLLNE